MSSRPARRVLLLGWDAADWKLIRPLIATGQMPTLAKLVAGGVSGNLATIRPILSPLLWNSIATGKRPDKHGIGGFVEPLPDGTGIRPVSSLSRKTKAIWNILSQNGLRSLVLGWYASHPAEPIDGVSISNQFALPTAPLDAPWPLPAGCVHPDRLREVVQDWRVHPGEIDEGAILPFIPKARHDTSLIAPLRRILAEAATWQATATWLMRNEPWDFTAVYFDAIDRCGHHFMPHHPPAMATVSADEAELYGGVMNACYRFHDMMLEHLLACAGPETTVLLISDHGFHSDHLRPTGDTSKGMAAALWHRQHGICCLNGPAIRVNEELYGATILDIAPTVLHLFGLPVGEDMDGRALVTAFVDQAPPLSIPSHDAVKGEAGLHPADPTHDPVAAREAVRQLVELGYMEDPGEDTKKFVAQVEYSTRFHFAQAAMDAGRFKSAMGWLEPLVDQAPGHAPFQLAYARCLMAEKRTAEARTQIETILSVEPQHPIARMQLAHLMANAGETEEALALLEQAQSPGMLQPEINTQMGHLHLRLRQGKRAEDFFLSALVADPEHAPAHDGLASVALAAQENEKAMSHALKAAELLPFFPSAHFHLGLALARLEKYPEAVRALGRCLAINPNYVPAHRILAVIFRSYLDNRLMADYHIMRARELRSEKSRPITAKPEAFRHAR